MKMNLLTLSLALMGVAAAAHAQTATTSNDPSGGIASVRDVGNFPPPPEPVCNDFTNRVVLSTPEYYTNTQAAAVADQQYRVREEGPAKGGTAMQSGPRIEPRPPTTYLNTDPWVELDHPWNFANEQTGSTSP
jgi:hypothetical protein